MAYLQGGTIQAQDYNWLTWGGNTTGTYSGTVTNLAMVWGTGYGYKGYGQTVTAISATTASSTVTATQWAGLVYNVNKALGHQGQTQLASGSNIGITAGATIAAFANVSTAVTQINTTANTAGSIGSTVTGTGITAAISWADSTNAQSTTWTRTVTFASADQARYFFNAGGYLNIVQTATNNNATARSGDILTILQTNLASLRFNGPNNAGRTGTGGTQTSADATVGYWKCTTSNQSMIKITSASATYMYTSDAVEVFAKTNGVQGSNGDVGTVVTFTFTVSAPLQTGSNFNDVVDVTATTRIDIVKPELTYLADVWGTITIA